MIKMWIEISLLVLAVPVGFLIAKLTGDEMKHGRKYFKILSVASLFGIVLFSLLRIEYLAYTFGFMLIVSFISLRHKI